MVSTAARRGGSASPWGLREQSGRLMSVSLGIWLPCRMTGIVFSWISRSVAIELHQLPPPDFWEEGAAVRVKLFANRRFAEITSIYTPGNALDATSVAAGTFPLNGIES